MRFEQYQEKLFLLQKLIFHANTGSPSELAKKLHVSERTARRLVEKLKTTDPSITYSRKVNSYITQNH